MKRSSVLFLLGMLLLVPFAFADMTISNIELEKTGERSAKATFVVTNNGPSVENGIIEMAFMPTTLSFFSTQQTCDPDFPWNVHKVYSLPVGGSETMTLEAQNIPFGERNVVLSHATQCCTDGVNNFACESKQPFGFEYSIGTLTFVDPDAGADDQCDTDFQALEYVRSHGEPACSDAVCNNAASTSSTASCTRVGTCIPGAQQWTTCSDGSEALMHTCTSGAVWASTGQTCPDGSTVPPPQPIDENNTAMIIAVLGLLIIAAVGFWLLKGRK